MTTPNPHALRHREDKARRIARWLWERLTDDQRAADGLPRVVADMAPADRLIVARAAGAHAPSRPDDLPPSDDTWALVVRDVVVLQRDERMAEVA